MRPGSFSPRSISLRTTVISSCRSSSAIPTPVSATVTDAAGNISTAGARSYTVDAVVERLAAELDARVPVPNMTPGLR